MKKFTAVLLTIIIMIPFMTAFAGAEKKQAATSMVVLGDSIAQGVGADNVESSYSYLVAQNRGYELSNFAIAGSISANMLARITNEKQVRAAISDADIIEISIGGNNLMLGNSNTSPIQVAFWFMRILITAFFGDYSLVEQVVNTVGDDVTMALNEIRTLNPDVQIIIQTLYNPLERVPVLGNIYEKATTILNTRLSKFAAEYEKLDILDAHTAFEGGSGLIARDNVHPSQKGHELLASLLEAKLDELGL